MPSFQPLTIMTKHSILDVAAALDSPLSKLRDIAVHFIFRSKDQMIGSQNLVLTLLESYKQWMLLSYWINCREIYSEITGS